MKADIAKTIKFRDATSGEDLDWTIRLARAGFLRTEYRSDESRIHYIYDIGDRQMGESTLTYQRTVTYENQLKNVLVARNTERPAPRPAATQLRLGPRGFMRT
jgi:GT2 family glycosyltransferase